MHVRLLNLKGADTPVQLVFDAQVAPHSAPMPEAKTGPTRHVSDWNICRIVESPSSSIRRPRMQASKPAASQGRSMHACGRNS